MTCFRSRTGWALFGGFVATLWSVSGIIVSFVGSGWYSYIKLMEGSKRSMPAAPVPVSVHASSKGSTAAKSGVHQD